MATHASFSEVFSKASDEAYVEYFLFPEEPIRNDNEKLEELLIQISIETVSLVGDYLWQKEPFLLKLDAQGRHFHGCLHYDINIEDEWFTVHILQQLTQKFPGLIARVIDQDGELLLIESAEHLPEWAESDEACQNRVYISNGKMHLVGEFKTEDGTMLARLDQPLEVEVAVDLVRKYPEHTLADSIIQRTIQMRVGRYPQKLLQNIHHVNLMLPPRVAALLKARPSLVAAAVRAFHNKDSIDMKAVRLMPNFSPIEDLVKLRVRFTKTLYSMLASEDYYPDRKLKWKFPLPLSPEFKGHSLGAKLTLGFEILLSRVKGHREAPLENFDFDSSPAWFRYEEKLKEYDYYRGLVKGSREQKQLEERAKAYFQSNVMLEMQSTVEEQAILEVQKLLSQSKVQELDLTVEDFPEDDDESWMDMNAANLDSLLAAQFKSKISDQKLDQIPEKLKEFMSQMSDFTGVEIHNDDSIGDDEEEDGGLDPLDFRADDFVSAMDKLLSELGKPTTDFDLSEPTSEEDEGTIKIKELEKKYCVNGVDLKMNAVMDAMDEELQGTEVGKTFQSTSSEVPAPRKTAKARKRGKRQEDTTPSTSTIYEPVDIDVNALTNILESFQSQEDPSGPSANLLRNVGFDISKAAQK